ncbi:MAG: sulfite exporter TauE/SafE family protein [Thiohalocapsa sp.]|uniref:sulfite exporter TauE/SafE family protein n=1 Tax=Thiohalocapsa sp. TaxID=2497641 RepID=UPI0025E1F1AC|nr:sulfite exporter TauE/SafE family protein [Thiohalocapsa sp.]MCG6942729.1 sulfite exporter TauE/SafE family protein [Thiohalocapsa sp.]
MPTLSSKAFRQQVLRPAEGVFLFHPRAIERLIEEQFGVEVRGVPIPNLPYYLMAREAFLFGLETENAEALSVIEGLRLPDFVILLPSPTSPMTGERGFARVRLDYWSRGFEAEVARAWQNARDDNDDAERYGAASLRALIGGHAFAEVRDVLDRDGITLSIWNDDVITRSFAAMVVRLRYFAPGARGFLFPAIEVWPAVDHWLESSGLDLPQPRRDGRMPLLLVKSRPGRGTLPATPPLLPTGLPFGATDPDLPQAIAEAARARQPEQAPDAAGCNADTAAEPAPALRALDEDLPPSLAGLYLAALERGSRIHRRKGWLKRVRDDLTGAARRLVARFMMLPGFDDIGFAPAPGSAGYWHSLGLSLFEYVIGCAQRAEFEGRFAASLRYLGEARRLAQRLSRPARCAPAAIEQAIAEREAAAETHLADLLAAKWKLTPATAEELEALIRRLAAEDRCRFGSEPARTLLRNLEQALAEHRSDYYRLRLGHWLLSLGRQRLSEPLPFQTLLKALRAMDTGRARLDEMPWPIADVERFGRVLDSLRARVTARLDAQLMPRVAQAMREADFVPRDHRERVAAHKMQQELLDVIKQRRTLKFTDVRDIVARNILRLPDPTLAEFFRGDRLARFDRTAARALPGVYRRGEIYIKGLQQLSAPLFGTSLGRILSRYLLVPFGAAYLLLKSIDLLIGMLPHDAAVIQLAIPMHIVLLGGLSSLVMHTGIGRHIALVLWRGLVAALRFVFFDGLNQLLRWPPLAALLSTGLVRGIGRHLVQPLLIGILPLIPIYMLAVFVEEVPIQPGFWLVVLAFALGTLARNTPAGRRFLDNLSTRVGVYLRRINQTLVVGLIQSLLTFFKEVNRGFSQLLYRVDEALMHHLGERVEGAVFKVLVTPVWRLAESLIQFYVTVLVEPQVNPVKHFPIVSIGHKLLLPFLPAITAAFVDVSHSILPKVVAYPLVTLTIVLLPGLFGFFVWELKENWKLYQANHREGLAAANHGPDMLPGLEHGRGGAAPLPVEPAAVGPHGESVRGLMARGFHAGALPKGFDRLRRVLRAEMRDQEPHPRRLLRAQRQLREVEHAFCVFFDREFTYALRERCRDPNCCLQRVETGTPRIATNLVELAVDIHPGARRDGRGPRLPEIQPQSGGGEPLRLGIRLFYRAPRVRVETELIGHAERIGPYCWSLIAADLQLFAGRAGADLKTLELGLPATAAEPGPLRAVA